MGRELCPRCRTLSELTLTTSRRTEQDGEGRPVTVVTRSYHCGNCRAFVRSEDERTKPAGK